jgi:putative hydrolases of HD superfamily
VRPLDQRLAFVAEVGRLKGVERQTVLAGLGRAENSAEHSWHLALLTVARTVGVLVAFVALLYGLHLLGFGPH